MCKLRNGLSQSHENEFISLAWAHKFAIVPYFCSMCCTHVDCGGKAWATEPSEKHGFIPHSSFIDLIHQIRNTWYSQQIVCVLRLCRASEWESWVKQYVFVSPQWKHPLRDGKSLAWHFSCCGQRFPWQVSLNGSFVFTDSSMRTCLKTHWYFFLLYSFLKVRTEA